jgi:hypothetical protein
MKDESSLEFDLLEEVRRKLTHLFERQGHETIEAERAALYIVQGIREPYKLIAALTRENRSDEEVLGILHKLFENAPALGKAHAVLSGFDEKLVH